MLGDPYEELWITEGTETQKDPRGDPREQPPPRRTQCGKQDTLAEDTADGRCLRCRLGLAAQR